ncbi:short-chain dehydrogenase [Lentibacillus sp. N15]|uniref:short-chain dehydrogenase n=1 Tax=Lentibacillus songyuanensis TaxID=3136161 RepID=UPI0031BA7BEB
MHALIIGGTGMLTNVSKWLIQHSVHTTVVARNKERLNRLQPDEPNNVSVDLLSLDYKNTEALSEHIKHALNYHGAIDTVVAWVHRDAPQTIPVILNEIRDQQQKNYHFFHIKGSSQNLASIKSRLSVPSMCQYHTIQLGFVVEGNYSRWLTHEEIADGVINAVIQKEEKMVIGQLEPWGMRP